VEGYPDGEIPGVKAMRASCSKAAAALSENTKPVSLLVMIISIKNLDVVPVCVLLFPKIVYIM
jgi:hypothetical protein